jgi:hypothetical protein
MILIAMSATWPALAAGDNLEPADEWVERGIEMRRARNDAQALEYFRRAYEIKPTTRTRVQMALAEQALGRWVEAEGDLVEALKAQGDIWIDRNRDKLLEGLETIRAHLGWLRVDAQPGAELWVDGARVGTLPLEGVRVAAKTMWIELRAPDCDPWSQSIEVQPKETVRLVARLVPSHPASRAVSPPPIASPALVPHTSSQRTIGWAMLGIGGVFLAEGIVAQIVRANAVAHYNDDNFCLKPGMTREELCGPYRGRAETAQTLATIGWIGGAAAIGTGVVLLLTSRSEPVSGPVVQIGSHEAGLSWYGRF